MDSDFVERVKEAFIFCNSYKTEDVRSYLFMMCTFNEENAKDIVKFCYRNGISIKMFLHMYRHLEQMSNGCLECDEKNDLSKSS